MQALVPVLPAPMMVAQALVWYQDLPVCLEALVLPLHAPDEDLLTVTRVPALLATMLATQLEPRYLDRRPPNQFLRPATVNPALLALMMVAHLEMMQALVPVLPAPMVVAQALVWYQDFPVVLVTLVPSLHAPDQDPPSHPPPTKPSGPAPAPSHLVRRGEWLVAGGRPDGPAHATPPTWWPRDQR